MLYCICGLAAPDSFNQSALPRRPVSMESAPYDSMAYCVVSTTAQLSVENVVLPLLVAMAYSRSSSSEPSAVTSMRRMPASLARIFHYAF